MIACIFHEGSGLGNQLHRYVFARVKASDLRVPFGVMYPFNFKGKNFMDLDIGEPVELLSWDKNAVTNFFQEERVNSLDGTDIRPFDIKTEFIVDNTIVDGEFQDEKYFEHRIDDIRKWLDVEPLKVHDNLCVINFRGGEYQYFPELFLTKDYWQQAVKIMRSKGIEKFEVHTDDEILAKDFFPNFPIIQDIAINWRSIRFAKHLIISNSSFAILPSLLGEAKEIIAPKFWARRNLGFWALPQNKYKRFMYI